jgi:thiamine biosynthesis lipoprotein
MMPAQAIADVEVLERFSCFGGSCEVVVQGSGPAGPAWEAVARTRRRLEGWHQQFSRFDPASELSRLNHDPRATVAVSASMGRFLVAALEVAGWTGGLVDPTLVSALEHAGYAEDLRSEPIPLEEALCLAPARRPARPSAEATWRLIRVDSGAGTVTRPAGLQLDSGGIAKGLFGDLLAPVLDGHASYAINAAGDVRFGGAAELTRPVQVASPFDDRVLHTFELPAGAAATSGIGKRSWLDRDGRPSHHLLDASTGRPAFSGIVQVTALAPTGVQAEALSKAALLSGPALAAEWLPYGGLIVYDDGGFEVLGAPADQLGR